MPENNFDITATWNVLVHDAEGNLLHSEERHNLIVDGGRSETLADVVGVGAISSFKFLGVGSSNTAAAETQTTLVAETTNVSSPAGSLTVRATCTDSTGGVLDIGDVASDATVPPYRKKIILQSIFATGDNNGTTMYEFGLFSSATFGAGTMFNRFVLGSSIAKTSSISVTVNITIRM